MNNNTNNNTNNHENKVVISSLIYIILLISLLLASFITGLLKLSITKILLIISAFVIIIGYIIVSIIRIHTYNYECSLCHNLRNIDFFEYIFSKKIDNDRFLTCDKCHDITKHIRNIK